MKVQVVYMGKIYKWKKYSVNIPAVSFEQIPETAGIYPIYGDRNSIPVLVLEKDIQRIPGLWRETAGDTLEESRKEVLYVTRAEDVIQVVQPDVFYPCVPGQAIFIRYSPDRYCATHYGKSSTGYWKYDSEYKMAFCYASDKATRIGFTSAELTHLNACTKGNYIEEVISENRNAYPDNSIAPLNEYPEYGSVCYWYEYAGEEDGINFPNSGQLEQFENSEGTPVFPLAVLEGIFRMSDGKSLASILSALAGGGPIEGIPGKGVPAGGTKDQILAKASASDYDTHWVDPPEGGGETADFSDLIKLPGGGEMSIPAAFGSAPYTITVTQDDESASGVTMEQVNEAIAEAVKNYVASATVSQALVLTEEEYTALDSKDAKTLYLIKE